MALISSESFTVMLFLFTNVIYRLDFLPESQTIAAAFNANRLDFLQRIKRPVTSITFFGASEQPYPLQIREVIQVPLLWNTSSCLLLPLSQMYHVGRLSGVNPQSPEWNTKHRFSIFCCQCSPL